MRDSIGSWLNGPSAALPKGEDGTEEKYRGERMGLPETGAGSLAPTTRRVLALVIDWLLSVGIGLLVMNVWDGAPDKATTTLLVWILVSVVGVWLFAFTPGQAALGMGVVRVDAPVRVGLGRSFFRVLLTVFIMPPLLNDIDGRGLHDRATQSAVIRTS
ncbi:RDD family protein [Tomitella biformata]|uniref:RDD family protein n=1 Tax=Tomitella biformata TaxID=630403 RepID=UPI000466CEE9|nr:RDD family protein [Tomitella biformata]